MPRINNAAHNTHGSMIYIQVSGLHQSLLCPVSTNPSFVAVKPVHARSVLEENKRIIVRRMNIYPILLFIIMGNSCNVRMV